jgi:tetratricopeptide (TPR) repeat protein
MSGLRGIPPRIAVLAAVAACASPPKVTPGSDYREEWQAARASFARANSLLHEGLLALSASDLQALVDAEDRLGRDLLAELRGITEEGAAHAEIAVALRAEAVEGHIYLALNLAILGLTKSRVSAMLEGLGSRIRDAYEKALAIDPGFAGGGAYRLKGKFLMSAPWPIRDYAAAGKALDKANEIEPVRQNYLFLGDLRFREGNLTEAVAMWRRACETPVRPETAEIDAAVLELARRRLKAASQE